MVQSRKRPIETDKNSVGPKNPTMLSCQLSQKPFIIVIQIKYCGVIVDYIIIIINAQVLT